MLSEEMNMEHNSQTQKHSTKTDKVWNLWSKMLFGCLCVQSFCFPSRHHSICICDLFPGKMLSLIITGCDFSSSISNWRNESLKCLPEIYFIKKQNFFVDFYSFHFSSARNVINSETKCFSSHSPVCSILIPHSNATMPASRITKSRNVVLWQEICFHIPYRHQIDSSMSRHFSSSSKALNP